MMRGWRYDSARHGLAARGVRTSAAYAAKKFRNPVAQRMWEDESYAYRQERRAEQSRRFDEWWESLPEEERQKFKARDGFMAMKPMQRRSLGVQFKVERLGGGEVYPVTPRDVQKELARMPVQDRKALQGVEFVRPKGLQRDAYAQYVRSKRKVLIFSQPVGNDGRIDGRSPEELRRWMKTYVVPHELGHHVALKTLPTDRRLSRAEARADGYAARMSVKDRDTAKFESLHNDV